MSERYVIDVKLTGFAEAVVLADSLKDALEKAGDCFEKEYMPNPINNLRWVSTECMYLNGEDNDS
jgi:hypothetical protein